MAGRLMALTARQVQLIQQSFSHVEPIADKAAAIFYAKLFEYDPSLRSMFKSDLSEQGKKLMSVLKIAVNSLNDLNKLVPVLQNLAKKHVSYGVKVDDYTPVGNALIYTLGAGLGKEFTDETKTAWIAVYKVIAQVMREAAYPNFDASTYKNLKHYQH
jgi:nitric oxide dioxygenase